MLGSRAVQSFPLLCRALVTVCVVMNTERRFALVYTAAAFCLEGRFVFGCFLTDWCACFFCRRFVSLLSVFVVAVRRSTCGGTRHAARDASEAWGRVRSALRSGVSGATIGVLLFCHLEYRSDRHGYLYEISVM